MPEKGYETISIGIEGAHQFAASIPFPKIQEIFLGYVNEAFVTGMKEAMLAGAITMVFAALISHHICRRKFSVPRKNRLMTWPKANREEFEAYAYANHAFFCPVEIKDSSASALYLRSCCPFLYELKLDQA